MQARVGVVVLLQCGVPVCDAARVCHLFPANVALMSLSILGMLANVEKAFRLLLYKIALPTLEPFVVERPSAAGLGLVQCWLLSCPHPLVLFVNQLALISALNLARAPAR